MEDNNKFLIVGLGNSENKYAGTRHNIGFEVVVKFAQTHKLSFSIDRHAYVAKGKLKGKQVVLILPTTYMNLSGKAVRYWLEREKIDAKNMLVISDDIDLPLGEIKIKPKGGGGSHNGLNNIIELLEHQNFPRLRFGIGKDFPRGFQSEYVLGRFSSNEQKIIEPIIEKCATIIASFVTIGLQKTMNQFNTATTETQDSDKNK